VEQPVDQDLAEVALAQIHPARRLGLPAFGLLHLVDQRQDLRA
jgi:hypothetical protein